MSADTEEFDDAEVYSDAGSIYDGLSASARESLALLDRALHGYWNVGRNVAPHGTRNSSPVVRDLEKRQAVTAVKDTDTHRAGAAAACLAGAGIGAGDCARSAAQAVKDTPNTTAHS